MKVGKYPAVERIRAVPQRLFHLRLRRIEPVQQSIGHKETVDVPECDQPAPDVVGGVVPEAEIVVRVERAVQPTHDVRAHLFDRLGQLDGVPGRLVHRLALLVEDLLVGEDGLVWGASVQRHRSEHHGVKPEPHLLAHLQHELTGEPLFPIGPILEVLQSGKPDDPRVQPAVTDVENALRLGITVRTADPHLVDPGPVQLGQAVHEGRVDRTHAQFGTACDHREVSLRTEVERQRQTPVALPGDTPISHVVVPVLGPLSHRLGDPVHGFRRRLHARADLRTGEKPLVLDAKDELLLAAPAERIPMAVGLLPEDKLLLFQTGKDRLLHVVDIHAREPAKALEVEPVAVERCDDLQPMNLSQFVVLGAAPRCDMDDSRPVGLADLVPWDHAVLKSRGHRQIVERAVVGPPHHLASFQRAELLRALLEDHRVGAGAEVVDAPFVAHAQVVEIGVDRRRHVAGQRPRRRRPDQ